MLSEESFKRALSINPKASTVEHNYGWLLCQQGRLNESFQHFSSALANPSYGERAKTLMALGLCQMKGGLRSEAENSLLRAYELDAGNPITGFNLATLMYQRKDFVRAQINVRRINNSELANAESLWLGVKIERHLDNREAMAQLGAQMKKRFPQSVELAAFERSAFDE
jgi:type IV pilus assembly protein PilF